MGRQGRKRTREEFKNHQPWHNKQSVLMTKEIYHDCID